MNNIYPNCLKLNNYATKILLAITNTLNLETKDMFNYICSITKPNFFGSKLIRLQVLYFYHFFKIFAIIKLFTFLNKGSHGDMLIKFEDGIE